VEAVSRTILLVAPFTPAPEGRHGGAQAIHGLAGALAERHHVLLVHLATESEVDPRLAARCAAIRSVAPPNGGRWARRLRAGAGLARGRSMWAAEARIGALQREVRDLLTAHRPDVVQAEYAVVGDVLACATRNELRILTIYDPAASVVDSLPFRREGPRVAHRVDARVAVRQERRVASLADAVVAFTERDRRLLAASFPAGTELAVIPLGWSVPGRALNPVGFGTPTLLFIGNFMHPPNIDAALRLAREILPRVQSAHPEVKLELVGPSAPPEVRALAGDAVRVTGAVPSVLPYLDRAALVVVPIALGGGMRVKVLEAMAAGKAVVGSSRATEGLSAPAGEAFLLADGDIDMSRAIARLLTDEDARRRIATNARAWAQGELAWATMADRYDELYARLEARRGGLAPHRRTHG
jgi:glycosyltransferase involved in cell wall biosynthesis